MQKYESTARVTAIELQVEAGQTALFTDFPHAGPASITVHPGAGATVYVSLCTSTPSTIKAGTQRYACANLSAPGAVLGTAPDGQPAGVVTAVSGMSLASPVTALRFVCVGGAAVIEIVQ